MVDVSRVSGDFPRQTRLGWARPAIPSSHTSPKLPNTHLVRNHEFPVVLREQTYQLGMKQDPSSLLARPVSLHSRAAQ